MTAAESARETDRATIKQSQDLHEKAQASILRAVGAVQTRKQQRRHILCCGIGTAVVTSLLWLVYPGWAASLGPRDWLWPERTARRTLGEEFLWNAGARLMRAGNPESWQVIMEAADMRHGNHDAIKTCDTAAAKAGKPVDCTIRVDHKQ